MWIQTRYAFPSYEPTDRHTQKAPYVYRSHYTDYSLGLREYFHCLQTTVTAFKPELSMGWVDPWVGLGLVGLGRDFSVFGGLGWVNYSKSTKNLKGLR